MSLLDTKPLPESMIVYCKLKQLLVKFQQNNQISCLKNIDGLVQERRNSSRVSNGVISFLR